MRKSFTIFNSISALFNRIITLAVLLLVRHIFVQYFDPEYLGYEGLFQNILCVFSLVDLGFGTAIAFDLYEPIHNKRQELINSIMVMFRRVYLCVGCSIILLSFCFVPFLLDFIKGYTIEEDQIRLYFLIYALGVAVSYFFSYNRTLVFALQRSYVISNIDSVVRIIGGIAQIYFICNMQSYALYLGTIAAINIGGNILITIYTNRYHFYSTKHSKPLPTDFRIKLKKHISALLVTNIAWQGISSTDNIIISYIHGVVDLSKNANYSMLVLAIHNIVSSILGGVSASIGDLIVEGNKDKILDYFYRYNFIYLVVSGYIFLAFVFTSEFVISIWVGQYFLFNYFSVFVIALNLFFMLNFKPIADYINYSGNFVYYKPYSVVSLFINLFFSVVLSYFVGVTGVFLGTTLAYLFMSFIVAQIVCKRMFCQNISLYLKILLKIVFPVIISFIILFVLRNILCFNSAILSFIFWALLITLVYSLVVFIMMRQDANFRFFSELLFELFKKVKFYNRK